jgi:hypothetical protein
MSYETLWALNIFRILLAKTYISHDMFSPHNPIQYSRIFENTKELVPEYASARSLSR